MEEDSGYRSASLVNSLLHCITQLFPSPLVSCQFELVKQFVRILATISLSLYQESNEQTEFVKK